MTTKTDFNSIMDLKDFSPENRMFVLPDEAGRLREVLELESRNNIELQNIRDMAVILFGQWGDAMRERERHETNADKAMEYGRKFDQYRAAMSAITCVIDHEKAKRGMEV